MTTEIKRVTEEQVDRAAFILKTVAHPLRLRIIELLGHKERAAVSEICEELDAEQSLVSHHLANLKLKGILACEREGKFMFYRLRGREILKLFACLEHCECNFVGN